ncbi:nucleotidyltransferase family protein [Vallitalea okinawensis]|uniref:hypothetical protein n=1 Tax=Vallitalea okinawensis TaxID=2078660 RepID=UPI000CFB73E6|nr:hypothetical protein [Vallitalea okinawensis]
MFSTLSNIGRELNENGILWGVGASVLLNHYGLIEKPNDIDILINLDDIQEADMTLRSLGEKRIFEKTSTYSTEYFYEYIINDIDIDVMAGLSINHEKGIYRHVFDCQSIVKTAKINDIDIPLTSLEDWYVIYQLIPNRKAKVKMIENYLHSNGVQKPELLKRALKGNLPNNIRFNIKKMLREELEL